MARRSLKEEGARRRQLAKPPSQARLKAAEKAQEIAEAAKEAGVSFSDAIGAVSNNVAFAVRRAENEQSASSKSFVAYTGVDQVPHGLQLPIFDPNNHLAGDLLTDSSPLPRTTKSDADATVESIEEKRQTVRVIRANLALNSDVVSAGIDYEKLKGVAIDYASAKVGNETKFVNFQTVEVNRDLAVNKLEQTQEKLRQGEIALQGLREITPLVTQEWQERKSLKQSQIDTLKVSVFDAGAKISKRLQEISESTSEIAE